MAWRSKYTGAGTKGGTKASFWEEIFYTSSRTPYFVLLFIFFTNHIFIHNHVLTYWMYWKQGRMQMYFLRGEIFQFFILTLVYFCTFFDANFDSLVACTTRFKGKISIFPPLDPPLRPLTGNDYTTKADHNMTWFCAWQGVSYSEMSWLWVVLALVWCINQTSGCWLDCVLCALRHPIWFEWYGAGFSGQTCRN